MGGLLAMALACERPSAVKGVFLIKPVYAVQGTPPAVLPRPVLAAVRAVMSVIATSFQRDGWLGRAVAGGGARGAPTGDAAVSLSPGVDPPGRLVLAPHRARGHSLQLDRPHEVSERLLDFVRATTTGHH